MVRMWAKPCASGLSIGHRKPDADAVSDHAWSQVDGTQTERTGDRPLQDQPLGLLTYKLKANAERPSAIGRDRAERRYGADDLPGRVLQAKNPNRRAQKIPQHHHGQQASSIQH